MSDLRVEAMSGDAMVERWRHVHNVIVPPAAMTLDEVRERVTRGYRPANAYAGDVLAGCSTVRPPQGEDAVVTVIARVLPGYRRGGYGTALHESGRGHARTVGAGAVETVVPAADEDGVRFAHARGFDEVERCVLPGGANCGRRCDGRLFPRERADRTTPYNDSPNLAGTRCALGHVQVE